MPDALHPDRCGGLSFLASVSQAFAPVLVAQGTLLAGVMANRIFFAGAKLVAFKLDIIGLVALMLFAIRATLAITSGVLPAQSATADESAADLAKKLSYPIAALISVPMQNHLLSNVGPGDGFRETTNIQPVIPFDLNEHWNLISRTILPVIYQEGILSGSGSQFGLGDTVQSWFNPWLV